jgi:hypothetical protein
MFAAVVVLIILRPEAHKVSAILVQNYKKEFDLNVVDHHC